MLSETADCIVLRHHYAHESPPRGEQATSTDDRKAHDRTSDGGKSRVVPEVTARDGLIGRQASNGSDGDDIVWLGDDKPEVEAMDVPDIERMPKLIPLTDDDIAVLIGAELADLRWRKSLPDVAETGYDVARPLDLSLEANPLNLSVRSRTDDVTRCTENRHSPDDVSSARKESCSSENSHDRKPEKKPDGDAAAPSGDWIQMSLVTSSCVPEVRATFSGRFNTPVTRNGHVPVYNNGGMTSSLTSTSKPDPVLVADENTCCPRISKFRNAAYFQPVQCPPVQPSPQPRPQPVQPSPQPRPQPVQPLEQPRPQPVQLSSPQPRQQPVQPSQPSHSQLVKLLQPSHSQPVQLPQPPHSQPVQLPQPPHSQPVQLPQPPHSQPVQLPQPPHSQPVQLPQPPHSQPVQLPQPPHSQPVQLPQPTHSQPVQPPLQREGPAPKHLKELLEADGSTSRKYYHQHDPLEGKAKNVHSRVILSDKEQHTEEHLKRWEMQIRNMKSAAHRQAMMTSSTAGRRYRGVDVSDNGYPYFGGALPVLRHHRWPAWDRRDGVFHPAAVKRNHQGSPIGVHWRPEEGSCRNKRAFFDRDRCVAVTSSPPSVTLRHGFDDRPTRCTSEHVTAMSSSAGGVDGLAMMTSSTSSPLSSSCAPASIPYGGDVNVFNVPENIPRPPPPPARPPPRPQLPMTSSPLVVGRAPRPEPLQLPRDILYMVCNLCGNSYGNTFGMKKHLLRDHDIEFSLDKICVKTISDYRRDMSATAGRRRTDPLPAASSPGGATIGGDGRATPEASPNGAPEIGTSGGTPSPTTAAEAGQEASGSDVVRGGSRSEGGGDVDVASGVDGPETEEDGKKTRCESSSTESPDRNTTDERETRVNGSNDNDNSNNNDNSNSNDNSNGNGTGSNNENDDDHSDNINNINNNNNNNNNNDDSDHNNIAIAKINNNNDNNNNDNDSPDKSTTTTTVSNNNNNNNNNTKPTTGERRTLDCDVSKYLLLNIVDLIIEKCFDSPLTETTSKISMTSPTSSARAAIEVRMAGLENVSLANNVKSITGQV